MIIYGWNTKELKQAPLENYECPNCQQKQSVLVIFAKYAHIFWIPLFPYSKSATMVCASCGHQTEEKFINLGSTVSVKQLKSAVPLPKYLFSGLALILVGIAYIFYSSIQSDKLKEAYITDPKAGDVYLMKNDEEPSEYKHYLVKVREVVGDSLWISYSSYGYNGAVSKLDPEDGFYDIMYSIHKDAVAGYQASGELIRVIRDYSASTGFDRDVEFVEADSVSEDLY